MAVSCRSQRPDRHLDSWALVLAAGEGSRLRAWTQDAQGRSIPKQYCRFGGRRSLLETTWRRAAGVAPPNRILTVVAAQHEVHWSRLAPMAGRGSFVVQPENRGTAAGILLPLWRIYRQDPEALVVVLPSDHFVGQEARFRQALREALATVEQQPQRIAVVGIRPRGPEADYGWILPSGKLRGRPAPVADFREKPTADEAQRLLGQGALINSFAFAASVRHLLERYHALLPELARPFRDAFSSGDDFDEATRTLYARELPVRDFSRHLLERAAAGLLVIEARGCGWTDLGTPERLSAHLREKAPQMEASRQPEVRLPQSWAPPSGSIPGAFFASLGSSTAAPCAPPA